jgi:glutathione S-transferase
MDLYFSPLACSMATRIALYEAGQPANYLRVDTKASPKRVEDGTLFSTINGMGQVPVLRTDEGELIRENAVILQYIADRFPEAKLGPTDPAGRRQLQTWLSFIGSELHTGVFIALLRPTAPDGAKAFARQEAAERFAFLDGHLAGQDYLLAEYSVADAYLFVMLTWARAISMDLSAYPAVLAWRDRVQARPAVAKAFAEEYGLYKQAA